MVFLTLISTMGEIFGLHGRQRRHSGRPKARRPFTPGTRERLHQQLGQDIPRTIRRTEPPYTETLCSPDGFLNPSKHGLPEAKREVYRNHLVIGQV